MWWQHDGFISTFCSNHGGHALTKVLPTDFTDKKAHLDRQVLMYYIKMFFNVNSRHHILENTLSMTSRIIIDTMYSSEQFHNALMVLIWKKPPHINLALMVDWYCTAEEIKVPRSYLHVTQVCDNCHPGKGSLYHTAHGKNNIHALLLVMFYAVCYWSFNCISKWYFTGILLQFQWTTLKDIVH